MKRVLEYAEEASEDLARIWQYHAEFMSIAAADALIHKIQETLRRKIARYPLSGRLRAELGAGIRSSPVTPYIVFYSAERYKVRIIRVLHGHRDIREPLVSLLVA